MLEFARLIEEAGFPRGVVNVLTGFGEPCGRALTQHPLVARVSFTGGPETARHIAIRAGATMLETQVPRAGDASIDVRVLLFVLGGVFLDRWLGTSPLFVILGTLVGAGLSFASVYRELVTDKANRPTWRSKTGRRRDQGGPGSEP